MKAFPGPAAKSILLGGLIAGTIDIGAACLIYRIGPSPILHSIASGVLGPAAFRRGTPSALWGLLLQWAMSLIIAGVYVATTSLRPALRRAWIRSGLPYGLIVFVVMNYVVVPLSAAKPSGYWTFAHLLHRFAPEKFVENLLAMVLFALIIAFTTHRLGANKSPTAHNREPNPGPDTAN